jgi:DNA-directed RNA polymerase subunit H (RpoH/RPB5)
MVIDRGYRVPAPMMNVTEKDFNMTPQYLEMRGITDPKLELEVRIKLSTQTVKQEFMDDLRVFVNPKQKTFDVGKIDQFRLICVYDANMLKLDDYLTHPFVEFFDLHLMFVNPTKHIYQPKWRLMTEDEIIEMLKRYTAKSTQPSRLQLGSICLDDPINRYYGGKPPSKDYKGDVYEIIRDGISVFYRKVVAKRMNLEKK